MIHPKILNKPLYAYIKKGKIIYIGFESLLGEECEGLLREIVEYLKGRRKSFSFEPDLSLYPNKVRLVLEYIYKNLGFGKVMTYGEIAKVLNLHPRFVGYALSKNRHLILIPCHRVISKNGLGGFSAGLDIKRFLLSVEGINIFPSLYP